MDLHLELAKRLITTLCTYAHVAMATRMTLTATSVKVQPQFHCSLALFRPISVFMTDIDEAEAGSCDCDDVCINKFLDRDGVKFVCECSDVNTILSSDERTCRGGQKVENMLTFILRRCL